MAEAHAEGKESFARSIATELFSDFLSVEERFAANKEATEQEVIDSLRQVSPSSRLYRVIIDIISSLSNMLHLKFLSCCHRRMWSNVRHEDLHCPHRCTAPTWHKWWTLW